jgi:hypothetical protein
VYSTDSSKPGIDRVYKAIAQLMLQSFQLFRPADKHRGEDLVILYTSACCVISELEVQENLSKLVSHGTYYIFQGIILAACCLLRLMKSPLATFDTENGRQFFFDSLNMLSNFSVINEDHAVKASTSLKNLWRSQKVFKNKDKSWNLELRVRNRYCMSVVYDCMWWSHEEFGGQADAFPDRSVRGQ